jgi:hypothetical protein
MALVWDVSKLPGPARERLADEDLAALWDALRSDDGVRAFRAVCRLAACPDAVPWLAKRARPLVADEARVRQALIDLDSARFTVREQARRQLEYLDRLAEPALRRVLKESPSLSLRRQVEGLLQGMTSPAPPPEVLRTVRLVEILETMGTQEARKLLRDLAAGDPRARLTREARAALKRVANASPSNVPARWPLP